MRCLVSFFPEGFCAIALAWWAVKYRFIRFLLNFSIEGVNFRSAKVCCELLHPIQEISCNYGLIRRCSLFHDGHMSPNRSRYGERERSSRLQELLRKRPLLRCLESYPIDRFCEPERSWSYLHNKSIRVIITGWRIGFTAATISAIIIVPANVFRVSYELRKAFFGWASCFLDFSFKLDALVECHNDLVKFVLSRGDIPE